MQRLLVPAPALLLALLLGAGYAPLAAAWPQSLPAVPADTEQPLSFERVSLDEGLSQVTVNTILQDSQGFLWIGTDDGLNRYDGYTFTVYKHDPGDPGSLRSNIITALHEDETGDLWVGTQEGLERFDPHTQAFEQTASSFPGDPTSPVSAITAGSDGALWVGLGGRGGLVRYDPLTARAALPSYDADALPPLDSASVTALHTDPDGYLWVGTYPHGLFRLDPQTGALEHYPQASERAILKGRVVTALEDGPDGALWVGTDAGVCLLSTAPARCAPTIEGVYASDLLAADDGALWVGALHDGLRRYDPATEETTHYVHDARDASTLGSDYVTTLLQDFSGVLWVGTTSTGLSRSDPGAQSFRHYTHHPDLPTSLGNELVWSIHEDASGTLWVGTQEGLGRRLPGQHAFAPVNLGDDGKQVGAVHAILEDRAGRLWVGTNGGGLLQYDRTTETSTQYLPSEDDSTGLPGRFVGSLAEDADGTLWVGTRRSGLGRLDPATGAFDAYAPVAGDSSSLGHASVTTLYLDGAQTLWVGTRDGLDRFDRSTGTFAHYRHDPNDSTSLSGDLVVDVYEDRAGRLWVSTYGGGLNRLDRATGTFTRYTEQNSGLPSNTVLGVLEGPSADALWLSTQGSGLVRFDPEAETFRSYDVDRGVQSKEFNMGAAHRGPGGTLYFGGVNGFNAFDPGRVEDDATPPRVVLTGFTVRSQEAGQPDASRRLAGATPVPVVLPHDQNDVSFDYVGLHYAAPERNRYSYRLDNYDEDWREAGTQRSAIYTNLDPGTYVFRVRAANRDGVWNEEGAALPLVIRPPWWHTWWAYGTYALLLMAGIFAVDRFQRRRLIQREREKALIREAELKARAAEMESMRQTRELEEARQLQLSMLPETVPTHPALDVAAYMHTATEVGGDYYDFATGEDGVLTVVIGDATGHGVRAGTMVTATKSLFNSLVHQASLVEMLDRSTQAIRRLGLRRLYMALALARFDGDRRLELAGAGLPPALIHRARSGVVDEVPLKGAPLGTALDYAYRTTTVDLDPGDTVVLMTDGFPETFDPEGRMLGYDRAPAVLRDVAHEAPDAIARHFARVSQAWAGEQPPRDDVTFVVLRLKPAPQPAGQPASSSRPAPPSAEHPPEHADGHDEGQPCKEAPQRTRRDVMGHPHAETRGDDGR